MTFDITRAAQKSLESLPAKHYKQVVERIFTLQRNQQPQDPKHLAGNPGFKRIDLGEYRIIYKVVADSIQIAVVGKRNDDEAYRRLARRG